MTELHETHVCRECGAEITMPYSEPRATSRRRLLEQLVVALCRISRSHVIEPWIHLTDLEAPPENKGHSGCPVCTWCEDCRAILGRDEVGPI